jgi:hypothetical protein
MRENCAVFFALVICVVGASAHAQGMRLTQVSGKFECPELANSQECARKFERIFLAGNPGLISRAHGQLRIKLQDGQYAVMTDPDKSLSPIELQAGGRFVAIHEQYTESVDWRILDRQTGIHRKIGGYPLFSPDETMFVAANEDLDVGYVDNVLNVFLVAETGFRRVFEGIPHWKSDWAARNVRWDGNNTIRFSRVNRVSEPPYNLVAAPFAVSLSNGQWKMQKLGGFRKVPE